MTRCILVIIISLFPILGYARSDGQIGYSITKEEFSNLGGVISEVEIDIGVSLFFDLSALQNCSEKIGFHVSQLDHSTQNSLPLSKSEVTANIYKVNVQYDSKKAIDVSIYCMHEGWLGGYHFQL